MRPNLLCLTLTMVFLAGCGSGGDSDDGGGSVAPSVQQYPAGIWIGTAGTGASAPEFIGMIDGGTDGKGGEFFFARDAGTGRGYDSLRGTLTTVTSVLRAEQSSTTYYSVADSKAVSRISFSGVVSGAQNGAVAGASILGNYSDPAGTAASTGRRVSFRLAFDGDLYNHSSSLATLAGSYSGGGIFGSTWQFTVDAAGKITGTNSGCALTGTATVRDTRHGLYGINLTMSGNGCQKPSAPQQGVAFLEFDASGVNKTGIWVMTADGSFNATALHGTAQGTSTPPLANQRATGSWVAGATSGFVLPDGTYFFYKPSTAAGAYDFLEGTLAVDPDTAVVSSSNGLYYSNTPGGQSGTQKYFPGIKVDGNVVTDTSLALKYPDPISGTDDSLALAPTADYQAKAANVALLQGAAFTSAAGLGGLAMSVTVDAAGKITGTRGACKLDGSSIAPYGTTPAANVYMVTLNFSGAGCGLTTAQTGYAMASFPSDPTQVANGLRIFTVGQDDNGQYSSTVFIGSR